METFLVKTLKIGLQMISLPFEILNIADESSGMNQAVQLMNTNLKWLVSH